MVWPTLGSRTAKEQNRTEQYDTVSRRGISTSVATPPPTEERSIVMSVSVCLCVCLSAILSSELHVRSPPNFFMHATYGRGSVLLWLRSDMLYTSGFVNDVIIQGCSTSPPS